MPEVSESDRQSPRSRSRILPLVQHQGDRPQLGANVTETSCPAFRIVKLLQLRNSRLDLSDNKVIILVAAPASSCNRRLINQTCGNGTRERVNGHDAKMAAVHQTSNEPVLSHGERDCDGPRTAHTSVGRLHLG